ncbi:Ankyrin repeat-containing protein [Spironucleus salmonicida]|uniref:Ankyrin repeat-containing protein n=1 Tax=Spironucleus salmonicida TaxID=348837 RepID=V6LJZ8_9EUKA|nr:Ankyrin repeat-containing protein [Spironucleus salmonicida]|eukprot:EST44940.1 Ankyrin repeat-containing protein [Spironucleus salmonicida]
MKKCCDSLEEAIKIKCKCISRIANEMMLSEINYPTPLMVQAQQEFSQFVFEQLSCFIGFQDDRGWTALMFAVDNYNIHAVNFLISEQGKINDWGFTALAMCCYSCFEEAVHILIGEHMILDVNNVSIAQQAIKNGHFDVLITLYDLLGKECLENRDKLGRDVFAYAAYQGQEQIIQFISDKISRKNDLFGRSYIYYFSLGRIDRGDFSNYDMDREVLLQ